MDSTSVMGADHSLPVTPKRRAGTMTPGTRKITSLDRLDQFSDGLQKNTACLLQTAKQNTAEINPKALIGIFVVQAAFIAKSASKSEG